MEDDDDENKAGMHGFCVSALPVQQRNKVTQISAGESITWRADRRGRGTGEGRLTG